MRTTLTLDDDTAAGVDRYQHERRTTFRGAVNELLRLGLQAATPPGEAPAFVVEPWHGGFAPGVDPERLHALLDDLDAERAVVKAGRS